LKPPGTNIALTTAVNAEEFIKLLEEMVDLKLQRVSELRHGPNAEVARLLQQKRETDRRRLEQIRAELVRGLLG